MEKPILMKSKEQIELEERISELEKRVATLEGQTQEQLKTKNCKNLIFYYLNMAQYLINAALPLIITKEELFASKPTSDSTSNSNGNIWMLSE